MRHLMNLDDRYFLSDVITIKEGIPFVNYSNNIVILEGESPIRLTIRDHLIYTNGNKANNNKLLEIIEGRVYTSMKCHGRNSSHYCFELPGTGILNEYYQPMTPQLYLYVRFDVVNDCIHDVFISDEYSDFMEVNDD